MLQPSHSPQPKRTPDPGGYARLNGGNPWAKPVWGKKCHGTKPHDYAVFRLRQALEDYPNIVYALQHSCSVDAAEVDPNTGGSGGGSKCLRACPLWQQLVHAKADVDRCLDQLRGHRRDWYEIVVLRYVVALPVSSIARAKHCSPQHIYATAEKSLEYMARRLLIYK